MQRTFVRSYDSLGEIFEFTSLFFNKEDIEESVRLPVQFVTEELFTNMVKYNPGNANDILLSVATDGEVVTVTLTDYDVDEFDVTERRDVDITLPLDKRKIGGLGLHLIQHMVDTLEYDYSERKSKITFTKGLA